MRVFGWKLKAARWLPYWLRYAVVINAGVDATTGEHSNQIVPDLLFQQVLERMK